MHHPGNPVFHEGSKGWSCCKRRVLEFDEFLRIPGCTEKTKHMFVGKAKPPGEEKVETVRYDLTFFSILFATCSRAQLLYKLHQLANHPSTGTISIKPPPPSTSPST